MKISDLSDKRIDEGFMDVVKRSGVMGQANKQAADQKQQNERAKSIGLKDFTNKLTSALQSAIKGGIVTIPQQKQSSTQQPLPQQSTVSKPKDDVNYDIPTSQRKGINIDQSDPVAKPQSTTKPEPSTAELIKQRQQQGLTESQLELFNRLVESEVVNEAAESVSKFITDFIGNQTKNLVDNPNYQNNINTIAKNLEDQYAKNKKLDPKLISQAWETIWAWSQLGKKRSTGGGYGQIVDMDHDGTDDSVQRDQLRKTMIQLINKTDFNDSQKLKSIEKPIEDLLNMIKSIK